MNLIDKITYHFLSGLSIVLRKIPLKNQLILSQHIASILFHYIPKRKNIAVNNIKISFPERSDKWIINTLKNCYKFLVYNFIQFLAFPESTNSIKIQINGQEELDKAFEKKERSNIDFCAFWCLGNTRTLAWHK